MDTVEARERIESWFPELAASGYKITSCEDVGYNCVAYAADDTERWWEPASEASCYWPDDAPKDDTVEALVLAFKGLGYDPCDDASLEDGYEKVALYGDKDGYTHAAKQLPSGRWTSKLGPFEDIEHVTVESLTGDFPAYGELRCILKRSRHRE